MKSQFEMVGDFHRKFNLVITEDTRPVEIISHEAFLFRYQFLHEELQELLRAHRRGDIVEVADALVDLVYVALGTAHLYGIPFDEIFLEVQRANMTKCRAISKNDSKRESQLDVVKPTGWKPPDVEGILKRFDQRFLYEKTYGTD